MIIGVLKEKAKFESRVALSVDMVKKLILQGFEIFVEEGAGNLSSILDKEYAEAGASIKSRQEIFNANLILMVRPLEDNDYDLLNSNHYLVGMFEPFNKIISKKLATKKVTAFALEALPRNTRAQSMDVLSSQANIAGYKAIILAAHYYKKFIPMLMTAAGTVKAARVIILGAGVAGLQAIATAKRLGAIVEASDVRPSVKEQIESLGAKFIDVPYETDEEKKIALGEGGYAKPMPQSWLNRQSKLVEEKALNTDIIVTSALIPGREPPILLKPDIVKNMKSGSVIVDMAAGQSKDGSGNCPLTKPDEIVDINGVTIIGHTNIPSLLSSDASSLYAKNITEFIKLLIDEKQQLHVNMEDELVSESLITKGGKILK